MDWTRIMKATKTTWGFALVGWTAALLAFALVLEHGFDMAPCALCLMQRFWFMMAGLVALAGIVHNPRLGIYPLVTLLAALVGGGFSMRQLWVESLPPGEAPACGAGIDYLIDAGMASEALTAMTFGTADCAATPPLLGLSIAAWALLGFLGVVVGAVMQWRARAG